jgi:hypothetical protein
MKKLIFVLLLSISTYCANQYKYVDGALYTEDGTLVQEAPKENGFCDYALINSGDFIINNIMRGDKILFPTIQLENIGGVPGTNKVAVYVILKNQNTSYKSAVFAWVSGLSANTKANLVYFVVPTMILSGQYTLQLEIESVDDTDATNNSITSNVFMIY